jgi:hypothetical protein
MSAVRSDFADTRPAVTSLGLGTVPGYESLYDVLERAYIQAAHGKGANRHARPTEPFTAQVTLQGAQRFGVGALLFQAYKKSEESQRLDTDAAVRELLGAIVYLSMAVIERERLGAVNERS